MRTSFGSRLLLISLVLLFASPTGAVAADEHQILAPSSQTPQSANLTTPVPTPTATAVLTPTVVTPPTPAATPTPTRVRPIPIGTRPRPIATPTSTPPNQRTKPPKAKTRRKRHHHPGSGTKRPTHSSPAAPAVSLPTAANLQAEGRLPGAGMPDNVRRWAFLILPAASANGIPASMIAAVMTVESGGDPLAWNPASDARGLMQILHGPWDPSQNIDVGAAMLSGFKQEFGSWKLALAAYNAGPGAVVSYGGVPPYQETEDYVVVVQYLYERYSNQRLSGSLATAFARTRRGLQRLGPRIRHLKPAPVRAPGRLAIPDGCDPSSPCRPRNLPHPISDPFWPLGGSSDPLPQVRP